MPNFRILSVFCLAIVAVLAVFAAPLRAQERALPYWATLRYDEVRMRVGPSGEYPIDWVYKRKGLPMKVVRMREGWRLVEDHEGAQGWIASSQLDPARGVLVLGAGLADLRAGPSAESTLKWRAEPGVVASLLRCRDDWCELNINGRKGWVQRARLWGAED